MKKLLTLLTALLFLGSLSIQADDYYVAHNGLLGGQEWNTNKEIMTSNGNGEYYRTYFAVPSSSTKVAFKVTTGSWTNPLGQAAKDNTKSDVTLSGSDNIEFTNSALQNITIWTNGTKVWVKVNDPIIKQHVLNGTKVMFYYGSPTSWGADKIMYFSTSNKKPNAEGAVYESGKPQQWKSGYYSAVGLFALNSSTTYYLSNNNDWAGNGKSGLTAGCFADMSASVTGNTSFVCALDATSYAITEGDASVAVTSTVSGTSGLGLSYSLDHYYISADGSTWSEFDPTNTSSLAVGTYTIKALATDGHIYLVSTNSATLTVSAYVPGAYDITATTATKWTYGSLPASQTEGELVEFTVTPNDGYSVEVSSSDATITKNGNTYSFMMPANDVAITVVATALSYNITYPATPSHYTLAGGNPTSGNTDAEIQFTATPDENYFLTVTVNGNEVVGVNNVYSFTMPAEAVTVAITATSYRIFDGSTPIYLKANAVNWWLDANAVQKATFTKADNTTVTVTGVLEEEGVYAFTPAAGAYKSVQFSRHNPSNVSEDWGHTDAINLIGTEANDYVTVFAQNSTNATWATFVPSPSYTFPAGTIIYYDLREYNGGVDDKDGDWHEPTNEIFGITLASDWKVTASTKLFRSGPNNNWGDRTCATLPTTGQNIIVVSSDGITCHWDTYEPAYTVLGEVIGLDWVVTSTTNDMTLEEGVYTLEMTNVELAVGNYAYKIVKDHSYNKAYPQEGNASMSITTAGIYNLTFTLDLSASPEYSVTPTLIQEIVVIPTVKMYGTFANGTDWAETAEFTLSGNKESASLEIQNLPAGNYDFLIISGSSYLGNGETFYRDYAEADDIETNAGNMRLEADITGKYTFTWTYETNTLSIEFPDEPTPEYVDIQFFAPRTEDNPWEHVYAYSYKGSRKFLGDWPGTEITSTKNEGWYTVSVRKGSNLIFTDNAGMQVNDIMDIQAAACYESTSIYYPENPEEAKKVTVTANANCEVAYYIAGSKALIGGAADFDTSLPLDENNQIVFHDVMPGTYSFKINNGTWAWALGGNDHLKSGDCQAISQTVGLGNVGFKIDTKQDITITYYPGTQEICLGAVTVKATGEITADNMAIEAGESKAITYSTNNTDATGATFTVLSGNEYIMLNNGVILGIKAGEASVRITVAETANYTAATKDITVTVSTPADPGIAAIAPVGGKFLINANHDTIVFARGNLQYQQSSNTWRCAPNQYDWKGMGNLQMGNAAYEGWVDLFCWSIGAENNYGATSAYNNALYYNKPFVDWGTLFTDTYEWSTLSINEWYYLLYSRPNADEKWGMAMIGDNLGMILLPEEWTAPSGVTFVAGTMPTTNMWDDDDCLDPGIEDHWRIHPENMPANKFTVAEWEILEAAGAVFFPYGGRRSGGYGNYMDRDHNVVDYEYAYYYYENYQGAYWTSTLRNTAEGKMYWLPMMCNGCTGNNENWGRGSHGWWGEGRYGHSVRLVTRIPREEEVIRDGLSDGKWGTICPKQNVEYVNGAVFYQISSLEEKNGLPFNMLFDEISGSTLTAGQPYFFIASAEAIKGSKVGDELDAAGDGVNGFYGYIGAASWELPYVADYDPASDNTFVIYDNSVFRINQSGTMLRSERCYIKINATEPTRASVAPAPGRRRISLSVQNTNVATGVENVQGDKVQCTKVIENGVLYLIYDGTKYNVQGQMVK